MNILMFFHGGSQNRGCEAIVRSSTDLIKDNIDNAKVLLVSSRPETDKIMTNLDNVYDGSDLSIRKYSMDWLLSSLKVKIFNDESYAYGVIHKKVIQHISEADVCLSIGGDNYCYGEQPGWYEIHKRVKQQGKKLILWGCSIGKEDMSDLKLKDLKMFDLILARETLTCNNLKAHGLENVELCADAAFTMGKEELPLPKGWKINNTIGLNFSPLVFKKNKQSLDAVKELINHILINSNMAIALTPHVIDEGNNDYQLLSKLYEEYKETGRVIILPDNLNAIQYKGYISRMRFFIGARTHATIAAYSSYVPTMVLGYSVKSKGIAKDIFGEEKLVLDINEISKGKMLIQKYEEMILEEKAIRKQLEKSIPDIQKKSLKAVDYLNTLFNRV